MNTTEEKYVDITSNFKVKNRTKTKVLDLNYYVNNGKKYYVDNKNVVIDYSKKEYEIAL